GFRRDGAGRARIVLGHIRLLVDVPVLGLRYESGWCGRVATGVDLFVVELVLLPRREIVDAEAPIRTDLALRLVAGHRRNRVAERVGHVAGDDVAPAVLRAAVLQVERACNRATGLRIAGRRVEVRDGGDV